jgi:hypothetical protein
MSVESYNLYRSEHGNVYSRPEVGATPVTVKAYSIKQAYHLVAHDKHFDGRVGVMPSVSSPETAASVVGGAGRFCLPLARGGSHRPRTSASEGGCPA